MNKFFGILYTQENGQQEILVSAARHDFHYSTDQNVFIDGGRDYLKFGGKRSGAAKPIWFEYKNVNAADLFNDWNKKNDKLGNIWYPTEKVKILKEKDAPDPNSFKYKLNTAIWGTNGINGDQPTTYKLLVDLETDHLKNILLNCGHISSEYRKFIKYILEERD